MRQIFLSIALLILSSLGLPAQQTVFDYVQIHRHRSAEKRVLVVKEGKLTFDGSARKLMYKSEASDRLDVAYDNVTKVVFDVSTHMRGGAVAAVVTAAPFAGPVVGAAIAGGHINTYWLYVEYSDHDRSESVLLEVPKNSSSEVIQKMKDLFGSRVTVSNFREQPVAVEKGELKDLQSKQTLKVDKQNHPLPEMKDNKATVVVVCPPLAARNSGKGHQFKLHANDQVVAVNREGTYSFAYLEPGKYRLVSQAESASGFEMELEAGREYFFLQNTFQGVFKPETTLTRNSPELVMYLLDGSYFSDWKPK